MGYPDIVIIQGPELLHISFCLKGQFRQVDGRKREIPPAAGFLRTIDIAHHPCAAAHRRNRRVIVTRLIIFEIIWRINIDKIGEQSLRAGLASLLEQIVVLIRRIVVDASLQLKD